LIIPLPFVDLVYLIAPLLVFLSFLFDREQHGQSQEAVAYYNYYNVQYGGQMHNSTYRHQQGAKCEFFFCLLGSWIAPHLRLRGSAFFCLFVLLCFVVSVWQNTLSRRERICGCVIHYWF